MSTAAIKNHQEGFIKADNDAAIEKVCELKRLRYQATGETINAAGYVVAVCAFEAGAKWAREKEQRRVKAWRSAALAIAVGAIACFAALAAAGGAA